MGEQHTTTRARYPVDYQQLTLHFSPATASSNSPSYPPTTTSKSHPQMSATTTVLLSRISSKKSPKHNRSILPPSSASRSS